MDDIVLYFYYLCLNWIEGVGQDILLFYCDDGYDSSGNNFCCL